MTRSAGTVARVSRLAAVPCLLAGVVLVPAGLLTLLRLMQPGQAWAVQTVAFAPFALVGYALALALLVPVFVHVVRRRTRGVGVAVGLALALAVTGAVLHLAWLAPQFVGTVPAAGLGQAPFRVMNLNVYKGNADPATVVADAQEQDVDVLVLEEVTPDWLGALEAHGIAESFPYRAGEPERLVAGTMVFARDPISAVSRLETSFDSLALDVTLPGAQVHLYAVHPYPPVSGADRWRDDLAALASAAGSDGDLDLIVGDFNATPDHSPFTRLGDLGFRSAAEVANDGWQPTWPTNGTVRILGISLPRLVQIDHVLIGPSLTCLWTSRLVVPGTDHSALVTEVAFR